MLNELLIEKWDSVRSGLLDAIDKFTDEELSFKPAASAYSAIETMLHIAHEEQIEVHWGLAARFQEMPAVYEVTGFSDKAAIIELLNRVHEETLAYLQSLNDASLQAQVQAGWGDKVRPITMLFHTLEHEIHHRAELSLMLGLLGRQGIDA